MSIDILQSYYAEDRIVGVRIQHCVRGHDGHWLGVVVGEEALIDRLSLVPSLVSICTSWALLAVTHFKYY